MLSQQGNQKISILDTWHVYKESTLKDFYPLFGMLAKEIWMHSKIERSESIDGISSWQSSWLKNALQQYLLQTQPNNVINCLCMMQPIKRQTNIYYIGMWQNGVSIHSCKYNNLKLVLEVWVLDFPPWDPQSCIYMEQIQQVKKWWILMAA